MGKQDVKKEVHCADYYDDEISIDDLQKVIDEAKGRGATSVNISSEYESGTVELSFLVTRKETDEEYNRRVDDEKFYKQQQEDRERKEFERLKAKFG